MEIETVDVTKPGDVRMNQKEVGEIKKYKVLKDEIPRMWGMKEGIAIPVFAGAKKRLYYKYHCPRLCETFDNRSILTESAGVANSNYLIIIVNDNNNEIPHGLAMKSHSEE